MANYYFCNGTTKKNRPCQNPVRNEGGKCAYHDGGRGPNRPGPSVFPLLKTGVERLIWFHATYTASNFTIELVTKLIEICAVHLNIHVNDIDELISTLEVNERDITIRLNSLGEIGISEIVSFSNFAVAIPDGEDDSKVKVFTAHA
jgi:hypothetical protein